MYFFNPKLQECKDFKEAYVSISEKLYGMIKVGAIDCLKEEELCEEFSAFDIPQILIFTEATDDDGERYRGEMKAEKIINAAAKKMQNFVSSVNEANYDSFVDRDRMTKNKIIFFHDKKSTPTIFKALSKKHVDRLNFGEVKPAEESLLK
jgi:DnaJ family protein C protein 16